MKTEDRIINKALELFNSRGIEYVGLRELAKTLDMRVSNITYYFPTKDDLVNRLSEDLNQLNSSIVVSSEKLTILGFLEMLQKVFLNHVKYRSLLLSFVHILEQNKKISEKYKITQRDRKETLKLNLKQLHLSGDLVQLDEKQESFLVSTLSLIIRFWISESAVSYRYLSHSDQIKQYLTVVAELFIPYSTLKGKRDIQAFADTLN